MARPRRHWSDADRQRAYRRRKTWAKLPAAEQLARRAENFHGSLKICAADGDPTAAQIVGADATETALKLMLHIGPDILQVARHLALLRMSTGPNADVELKQK